MASNNNSGNDLIAQINNLIASHSCDVFFSAVKAFRNGVVYGTRVRAPHALVLNMVWSKDPYSTFPRKIYNVTKEHALGLGSSGVLYVLVRQFLARCVSDGRFETWHATVAGFLIGALCWGNPSSMVHLQMMMYIVSRMVVALYHLYIEKCRKVELPTWMYRVYSGCLWGLMLTLLMSAPQTLQPSMRSSLRYIFVDSLHFTNLYNLIWRNQM